MQIKTKMLIMFIPLLLLGCNSEEKDTLTVENNYNEYNLSMIMAGDALIHAGVYNDAYEGINNYNFDDMFENLKPIIPNYDLAFYNQETIIGGKKIGLSTYPRFNSPEELGDSLTGVGFNMVSLANNHTLDRGEEAIINSTNYWNGKNVITAGSYLSFEDRKQIVIHEKNNIRYAFLAYTTLTNGLKPPEGKEYLINIYNDDIVKDDIEQIKNKVDVIIVSMHWGTEYTHIPTKEQKRIANDLASLGVHIIIGHHPHVIQPIEYINDTLVVYSLGNFISGQIGLEKLVGMMVSLNIKKKIINAESSVIIEDVKGDLIYTYCHNYHNYKVIPFSMLNNNLLNNYQKIQTVYSSIINQYDKTIKVGIFD